MASIGRRLLAASACLVALYACAGERKIIDEPDRGKEGGKCRSGGTCDAGLTCLSGRCVVLPGDAGAAGETSTEGGSGGVAGSSNGGSGNQGGTDPSGGSPGGESSSGEGGGAGTGGDGGMSAMGGAGGQGGLAGGGMGTSGNGGAGRGGLAGASGGGAGGFGTGGVCTKPPSIAELFPASVPTDQRSGLDGDPSPDGAPSRSFDGYLIQAPCTDTSCDDCQSAGWAYAGILTPCTMNADTVQNFRVGGTPGAHYRVRLHFYGVVGPKNYGSVVTRASGPARPMNLDTGADPPPWAYADGNPTFPQSDYDSFEIHVVDHHGQDVCSYYVNSDTAEGHWTYVLNYEKTIDVIGAGRIRVRYYDRNCRMIKNCGGAGLPNCGTGTTCETRARTVDTSGANPPSSELIQPGLGNDAANSGQWLYVDVTSVTCGPTALGCNGL